jgi:hypothetical protein
MADSDYDFLPLISQIPGPRGAKGDTGAAGAAATDGKNAYTTTTAPFIMPAPSASVTVTVTDTSWMAQGQTIFIEGAGYGTVSTILSATSISWTVQDIPTNTAQGTTIATGKKVTPGGIAYIPQAALDDLANRITTLELAPGGNRNFYQTTAPGATGLKVDDNWYDTDDNFAHYRWDGSAWVPANRVVSLADFGTGLRPIVKVDTLPTTGYTDGDFVWLSTDGKLYRRVAGVWTKAIATGDLVGQVDASTFIVDGTIIAQKLGANSVTADKVGANQIITSAANIASAIITDAHIANLGAGKITAGDIQSVNIGYTGRIFHPTYSANKFRSVDFGTSFADDKIFGAGNALTAGYAHATPVTAYGPGNAGWSSSGTTACPDSEGKVRVQIQGRLIGHTGNILVYCQINNGTPVALAARSSSDSGNALIDSTRFLTGVAPTDIVKIYVAPADAAGTITPVTCRYEIDVTFYNW